MPLGFERLNERQQRPNAQINFIKPLEGPDKSIAEDFLQRIAAQCYPVMKKHYISVMSLEEYPPNREFLGRNFNAGEVIQLVLKDRQGRWLSFKFVQMVMMHELAHCKQMNHGRYFWNVRNEYAKQMEELWREKYVGEGIWGRGRGLQDGRYIHERPPDNTQIPEHLCGGSYRRRGRKRMRGQGGGVEEQPAKLSYAERQQRRIARKFGKHGEGESLGDDELVRGALETMNGGKRSAGKPRVANSKRGRELRANAALARFEQNKAKKEEDLGSETESDWDDDVASRGKESEMAIKDEFGHDLIKICGDEAEDDREGARNEMDDLRMLGYSGGRLTSEAPASRSKQRASRAQPGKSPEEISEAGPSEVKREDTSETESDAADTPVPAAMPSAQDGELPDTNDGTSSTTHSEPTQIKAEPQDDEPQPPPTSTSSRPCPICSLENTSDAPTCMACAHVLRPALMPDHWLCQSDACRDSAYINAGDAGRCGICGGLKPARVPSTSTGGAGKGVGTTRADVLRWD